MGGRWLLFRATARPRPAAALTALAGITAGLSWLTRVNSVVVAPMLVLALWLSARDSSRERRAALIGVLLAPAMLIAGGYPALIHHPTTGAWKYSYVLGWDLKNQVADAGIPFDRANGPASAALIRYQYSGIAPRDALPKVTVLAEHLEHPIDAPLATKLRHAPQLAQSTTGNFEEKRLYLLLGFQETDSLLTQAALETIAAHPLSWLLAVARTLAGYFYRCSNFSSDFMLPDEEHLEVIQPGRLGFMKVSAREAHMTNDSEASHTKAKWAFEQPSWVWLPGIRLLNAYYGLFRFLWVLSPLAFLLCLALFLCAAPRLRRPVPGHRGSVAGAGGVHLPAGGALPDADRAAHGCPYRRCARLGDFGSVAMAQEDGPSGGAAATDVNLG